MYTKIILGHLQVGIYPLLNREEFAPFTEELVTTFTEAGESGICGRQRL
jgi:hypothetical protein